jgi:tetratricopeptide (TPR) repeat protein
LLRLEQFADAERLFRNATELDSEYDEDDLDEAWHMLGVSLLAQERLEEAAEAFQRALEVNPQYELSRIQLEGLKQVEVVRKMIADDSSPKVDSLV